MQHPSPAPHPLEACVVAVENAFGSVAGLSAEGLEVERLVELVGRSQRLIAQAQSFAMRIAAAADKAGAARSQGAASTADLMAGTFGGDRIEANRMLNTAKSLEGAAPTTGEAMARGELGLGQVQLIAKTMGGLPKDLTEAQREAAEATLIDDAKRLTLKDLHRRADRIADTFAPDKVDQIEQQTLVERERAARARAEFWMSDQRDGTYRFGGLMPELHADTLKTMLDAVAAPRRDHLRPDQIDAFGDRTYPQRMGLAFLELIEHLPSDGLPAGGTTLTVNFDYHQLVSGIGAATGAAVQPAPPPRPRRRLGHRLRPRRLPRIHPTQIDRLPTTTPTQPTLDPMTAGELCPQPVRPWSSRQRPDSLASAR